MSEQVRTIRPIINEATGVVLVPGMSVGTLLSWVLQSGLPGVIPRYQTPGGGAGRDIEWTCRFIISALPVDVKLRYPLDFEFLRGTIGWLNAAMFGATITSVDAQFSAGSDFPLDFPTTLRTYLNNGLIVKQTADRVSGTMSTELEAA